MEIPFTDSSEISVGQAKSLLVAAVTENTANAVQPDDVKLIFKGKVLDGNETDLCEILLGGKPRKATYRLVATGVSRAESETMEKEFCEGVRKGALTVRDDLSEKGQQIMKERRKLGRQMMKKVRKSEGSSSMYGFGRIEALPNLPDEAKAHEILTTLANDPGIQACMAKHKWKVGSLAELYPKGKVGESEVCVMGLNRNKGQQILLRIRTDDLTGFRKIQSIREVLYHELAHNVHSEHDSAFFQLMRQIKSECLEMDWTKGNGTTTDTEGNNMTNVTGGTYVLGGKSQNETRLSARELAGRAAMLRLSAEEEEVRQNCGCGHEQSLFCPSEDNRHDERSRMDES